ncbi:hypothetical protein [Hyphomicrobium sp.]|uniref:hypothetical protein n=1 Tax=Hyphomicrobium sp. TaxID=82 RepID=UPI001D634A64|nr:hypothetical protein [Hyphomicrobium sp.]MBY0562437.1 hypothetical protein [Hyphomicrobium sp.]
MNRTVWPDPALDFLRAHYGRMHLVLIAENLTRITGRAFTTNAIIGKANRMGLSAR